MHSSECCDSRCSVGSLGMKMLTTPSACAMTPRCAGSSAARQLRIVQRRRARWGASRPSGSRRKRTYPLSPIFQANGSIACMTVVRREGSGSTWIRVSPTHGEQENSVWNGHYDCTCYHPLFVFNQFGDLERCALRPGNVHSADGWQAVLKPVVAGYRGKVSPIYFRADAGFANPEVYEYLESEGIEYAIRLPANRILQERIGYLLKRPAGRPSNDVRRSHASFTYQAGSWSKPRRVIAKVEWHPGELYPRVGFIVTNMSRPGENVVAFYNKRGTCEQWIKEGKGAVRWTRLSCRAFAANGVRLQLHTLAYNLGNFLRTLATPEPIKDWSLTSLKEKLIKIGAKVVSHGRYVAFQMAEVAISRHLFADILRLIAELRPPPITSTA